MTALSFTVLGVPQPAGSKRAFPNHKTGGVIVTDDAKNSRPWKQEVAGEAARAVAKADWPLGYRGPVVLTVSFYLQRPKGHMGSGRVSQLHARAGAPAWPAVKPDSTKLLRAVEDALIGIAFHDDAQVVEQLARKRYDVTPRAEISVRMLPWTVADAREDAL